MRGTFFYCQILPFGWLWIKMEYMYNRSNGSALYNGQKLFPKYRVSIVKEDREGNLWLTTMRKGILIVPNKNIISI